MKRERFLSGALAASGAAIAPVVRAEAAPERPNLRFGIAVDSAFYLPEYVAAAKTWAREGLSVELAAFRGDAQVSQALAGDSIDVMVASTIGLITMISANQPVQGFYAGLGYAGFTWVARPEIKRWSDLKGKSMGIATYGSLNDSLSRYALTKHGLTPDRDVHMIQAGTAANCYQALLAGRLDSTILSAPYTWNAQGAGMTTLGTQAAEVTPVWPTQIFSAKKQFISENPNTILAVLRAYVNAVRLIRKDKAYAASVLVDRLKLTPADATRSIEEDLKWWDERGRLPDARSMQVFWTIEAGAGSVQAPWPTARFLDTKYIDSFASWAPRA